jgi:hypothetical protein
MKRDTCILHTDYSGFTWNSYSIELFRIFCRKKCKSPAQLIYAYARITRSLVITLFHLEYYIALEVHIFNPT